MLRRVVVIFALLGVSGGLGLGEEREAPTQPAAGAQTPGWWLHRALKELEYYQDPRGGNRRFRQSQMDLLEYLYDLQTVAGDRTGRIDTCRFVMALMNRRGETDEDALVMKALPADAFPRYAALIAMRPAGVERDRERGRAVAAMVEKGELGHALSLAGAIDDPTERNSALSRVIQSLAAEGRDGVVAEAARRLAPPDKRSAAWKELYPLYCIVAPAQAKAGKKEEARESLAFLAEWEPEKLAERVNLLAARVKTYAVLGEEAACRREAAELVRVGREGMKEGSRSAAVAGLIVEALTASPDAGAVDGVIEGAPETIRGTLHVAAADALADEGKFGGAAEELEKVPAGGRDLEYWRQVNRLTDAGVFLWAARLAGMAPDEACGIGTYGGEPAYEHLLAAEGLPKDVALDVAVLLESDAKAKVKRLGVAARFAHRAGEEKMAEELIGRAVATLTTESLKRYAAEEVIRAQVAVGKLDDAAMLALAERPESVERVARAYAEASRCSDGARMVRTVWEACERAGSEGNDPPLGAIELANAAAWTGDRDLLDAVLPRAASAALSANGGRPWNFSTGPWRDVARAYARAGRLGELMPFIAQVRRANSRALIAMMVARELLPEGSAPPLPE